MTDHLKRILLREIDNIRGSIDAGTCELTETEGMQLVSMMAHEAMSKEQVLVYLGWSRAKFDDYCSRGLMPRGRKRVGFKELVWYRNEINDSVMNIKQNGYG